MFRYFPGAAAASRVYVDALSRLARQAQLGTWGGSKDVGKFRNLLIIVVPKLVLAGFSPVFRRRRVPMEIGKREIREKRQSRI